MSIIPVRYSAAPANKQSLSSKLISNTVINDEIFRLEFAWAGPPPCPGQFFLIKPERTGVFLGRPISVAGWKEAPDFIVVLEDESIVSSAAPPPTLVLGFLIAKKGKGTADLAVMQPGENAELSGPLGNRWFDFGGDVPEGPIALVSGGIGVAPLAALALELGGRMFDFYAGFRSGSYGLEGIMPHSLIIATEDGSEGLQGRIPDFFSPAGYSLVYACGPAPMLRALQVVCDDSKVPCYISMERRMACGVGACLGCTVQTLQGNRRCCADGPIFPAQEVIFGE
jgi:NAD(P)H-flavin reductase